MADKINDLRRALAQTDCPAGEGRDGVAITQRLPSAGGAPARVVVLLAVGREIEWFGASTRFAPSLLSPSLQRLAQRQYRRGVGAGSAWPIALRPRLMQALRARGLAHLWVEEHGYVHPDLRGRRVACLWQPVGAHAFARCQRAGPRPTRSRRGGYGSAATSIRPSREY